jgi:hypothetical protein
MMPASLIDDDKAVAPVACRQHQPCRIERRVESLAALRAMQAIENRVADVLEIGAEPPRFLELVAGGGPCLGVRRTVVRDDP